MGKAAKTRLEILRKAHELIYQHGYQATSVDKIIDTTAVTKGAFYYHFKTKEEMGIAMLKEVIVPTLAENLWHPLKHSTDPLTAIYTIIANKLRKDTHDQVNYGCPTNNLVQEMSPLNERFQQALRTVLDKWMWHIEQAIEKGKQTGTVPQTVDAQQVSAFVVVGYEGLKSLGKVYGKPMYETWLQQLKQYLESLR